MAMFKGFKPQGLQKIANSMGYTGSLEGFSSYLQQNPDKQNMMNMYNQRAMQMAQGGAVLRMQQGGGVFYDWRGNKYEGVGSSYNEKGQLAFKQRYQVDPETGVTAIRDVYVDPNQNFYRRNPVTEPDPQDRYSLSALGYNIPKPQPPAPKPPVAKPPVAKPPAPAPKPPAPKPPAPKPQPPAPKPKPPNPNNIAKAEVGGNMIPAGQKDQTASIVGKFPMGNTIPGALGAPVGSLGVTDFGYAQLSNVEKQPPGGEYDPRNNLDYFLPGTNPPLAPGETRMGEVNPKYTGGQTNVMQPIDPSFYTSTDPRMVAMREGLTSPLTLRGGPQLPPRGVDEFGQPLTTDREMDPTGLLRTLGDMERDGRIAQPEPLPQQYIPQMDDEYLGGKPAADPYANYRQNVERFPETGTFKNPAIQTSFDAMQEELAKDDTGNPFDTRKSDKILDYVRNIYSGPIRLSEQGYQGLGGGNFTEEFKNFAKQVGLNIANNMAADGPQLVSVQEGSPIATIPGYLPPPTSGAGTIGDITGKLAFNPALPEGATATAVGIGQSPDQMLQPGTGQVSGTVSVPTAMASTTMAEQPGVTDANLMTPEAVAGQVNSSLDSLQAAQTDPNDPRAKVLAAQQTKSAVSDLNAAQGSATLMENPVQREIQDGELISGVADAEKASKFTEQIQAATATPSEKATVQGQLAQLTQNFDANNPPAWAAGALRGIQGQLAARGLGASSIAGQALIQGALESALPIAQADAQTQAQFESQNLSNRQQRAMLAAQQRATFMGQEFDQAFQARVQNSARIGDIANMNFTAEQNIALENSRAVNTMNLNNLSNRQAMVMAEASALANMDMANLNNRQQSAVQNAQNFLQMDMANLSNQQQTDLFKAQQRTQALFTDQAAENAARQFNASSQNQVDQFFANLGTQVAQFNATQANAQSQFNAGQANTVERFNAELNNQRDQFNAQNQMIIAQSNAQWRRQIATADTAAINRANELNASALLDMSKNAYDNLWQYYADTMEWAWTSAENELDRMTTLAEAQIDAGVRRDEASSRRSSSAGSAIGNLIGTLGTAYLRFGL